jgi:hypothetical protein
VLDRVNIDESNNDFYGKKFRLALVGYIRGEKKFSDLNELIDQIKIDIAEARESCDKLIVDHNKESNLIDFDNQKKFSYSNFLEMYFKNKSLNLNNENQNSNPNWNENCIFIDDDTFFGVVKKT